MVKRTSDTRTPATPATPATPLRHVAIPPNKPKKARAESTDIIAECDQDIAAFNNGIDVNQAEVATFSAAATQVQCQWRGCMVRHYTSRLLRQTHMTTR